jgi:hypothetical protein
MSLIFLFAACSSEPKVPEAAGVVQAIEPTATQTSRFVLDTGAVLIDIGRDQQLYGGGSPRVGDLIIVGTDGQKTWYLVIVPGGRSPRGGHCFPLLVTGVDGGNTIDTDIGVRLPKTPDFNRGGDTDGIYNEQPHEFCLDERGAIYAWI